MHGLTNSKFINVLTLKGHIRLILDNKNLKRHKSAFAKIRSHFLQLCRIKFFWMLLLSDASCQSMKVKKLKYTLVQALRLCTGCMAHRESRSIALLFHDHGTRRGLRVSVTPRPLFTPGKDPVPIQSTKNAQNSSSISEVISDISLSFPFSSPISFPILNAKWSSPFTPSIFIAVLLLRTLATNFALWKYL